MDTKKEAKKYLNKYFKTQYLKETDDEYKSLVRLLNKALRIHDVVGRSEQLIAKEQDAFDKGYTKGWTEGFNSGKVNGD